ncbi:ectonucleoside triphosphate diphosphohydrolase 5-like isoform X3 [Eleginops maclovinus]|uniref:ectonucleoside triphosphate diphosphohydrolase 5-like isoform X3 n=1 Tax=Eleginops maclovinus TaxID=56733 RepID=UPI00307FECC3
MKPAGPLLLLLHLLAVVQLTRARVKTSLLDLTNSIGSILPSLSRPANHSHIFYAVMFDAGSTGTRIHVYTFIHSGSEELPVLDNEMFHSIKPGLSAYAGSPEMAGHTVRMLLKVAKKTVPRLEWKRTPLFLRATAGLRLLSSEKARLLLEQVQHVFDESPFLVPDDSVSIMNGTNEGILAWISVNYLTGHLNAQSEKTVGILDLGGGSTQITFLPKLRVSCLFCILQGPEWRVFKSSCLPKKFRDEWSFGGLTYRVSGDPDGPAGYKLCYQEVLKVVKGIIHQPYELQDSNVFYAFSYYFDRAVDAGLIDGVHGGTLEVRDFRKRAKEVCNKMTKHPPISSFLCMDMTYITCLLKDGFGFKESTVLQLTKKVNNVEASWALGATLDHLHNLKIL